MTNKEALETYNTRLNTNNTDLNSILETINNLPDAGSGEVEITLQEKTITPTTSGQTITPDENYDGLSKVVVNAIPSNYIEPTGTKTITENGTYDVTNYASANVDIESSDVDVTQIEADFIQHRWPTGDYYNDKVTLVRYGTFFSNNLLTGIDLPNVTQVEGYGFASATNLKTLNMPKLTSCAANSFSNTGIENVYLPELTSMNTYSFGNTTKIKTVTLPKVATAYSNGFRQSTGIHTVDLGACTTIQAQCFFNCYMLTKLIIRTNSVCSLANISAFSSTPINGYTTTSGELGYVYVPDDLVDDYKGATNWSTIANQIKGISELGE